MPVRIAWIIVALALTTGSAEASPLVYEFTLPDWTFIGCGPATCGPPNLNVARFGSNGIVDFTVDNGDASPFSQIYTFDNVISVEAKTNGGTYDDVFAPVSAGGSAAFSSGPLSLISTAASGTPELLLTSAFFATSSIGTFSLSATSIGEVDECCNSYAYVQSAIPSPVIGHQVPEPSTIQLLVAAGIFGLCFRRPSRGECGRTTATNACVGCSD